MNEVQHRIERETGMLFRFVVGHSEDEATEAAMNSEIEENGAFLRLPIQVKDYTAFCMKHCARP